MKSSAGSEATGVEAPAFGLLPQVVWHCIRHRLICPASEAEVVATQLALTSVQNVELIRSKQLTRRY